MGALVPTMAGHALTDGHRDDVRGAGDEYGQIVGHRWGILGDITPEMRKVGRMKELR